MEPREIHVVNKTPSQNIWLTIGTIIAIPLAIAVGGWITQIVIAQESLEKDRNALNKDYVAISVSILNSKKDNSNKELRDWAIEIINKYAPIQLPQSVKKDLSKGGSLYYNDNIKVQDTGVLIVKDGEGGNSIISFTHQNNCRALYTWKHFSKSGKVSHGTGKVFENYKPTDMAGNVKNEGQLIVKAGPVSFSWSCGSNDYGWVYPNGYESKFIYDINIDDFQI